MDQTSELISFYAEAIEKHMNKFSDMIFNIASQFEDHQDEEERQRAIMEDMLHVFDTISVGRGNCAWDKFHGKLDSDKIADYQLDIIKGIVHDHCPNIVKSCDTILVEGC